MQEEVYHRDVEIKLLNRNFQGAKLIPPAHISRARICKRLRSPGIDSEESILPGWESIPVPEIIDPVFAKTSQNARFLLSENKLFGLVFVKTGSINSGTGLLTNIGRWRAGTKTLFLLGS